MATMTSDELRALQAPLKAAYRERPEAARITLSARGRLDGAAVACKVETPLRGGEVLAEGELDFRGTLGVSKDAPVGFSAIRLRFALDTDADQATVDKLLALTERYCVVYQTLRSSPALTIGVARDA
jgi:hypothetical protein